MKISVVMQSYLGNYPGSRSNPEFKFTRAVHSFLSQTHDDKELIIVSDGCDTTKLIYDTIYSHDPRIHLCYLSKPTQRMYSIIDGNKKFFRGTPRRIGCSAATGDIITYMDSDDIMLPNRLSDLQRDWTPWQQSVKWASNAWRYLHQNVHTGPNKDAWHENKTPVSGTAPLKLRDLGYDITDTFWQNEAVPQGWGSAATYSLSHRRDINVTWQDCYATVNEAGDIIDGTSEDVTFFRNLQKTHGGGFRQESPAYVVCHYRNHWDV